MLHTHTYLCTYIVSWAPSRQRVRVCTKCSPDGIKYLLNNYTAAILFRRFRSCSLFRCYCFVEPSPARRPVVATTPVGHGHRPGEAAAAAQPWMRMICGTVFVVVDFRVRALHSELAVYPTRDPPSGRAHSCPDSCCCCCCCSPPGHIQLCRKGGRHSLLAIPLLMN